MTHGAVIFKVMFKPRAATEGRPYSCSDQALSSLNARLVGHHLRDILIKNGPISVTHLQNSSPDQVPRVIFQTLVPHRCYAHLHWSTRQFQSDVQLPLRSSEIMFANPNGRDNQRQTSRTNVERVAIKRWQTPMTIGAYSGI